MTIIYNCSQSSENSANSSLNDSISFESIIRSIIISRAKAGATIEDIRNDYYEHTGEKFPYVENICDTLLQIPGVAVYKNQNGTLIFNMFYTDSKSQHILNMVRNQKPDRKLERQKNIVPYLYNDKCFFKDNYQYLHQHTKLKEIHRNDSANLYGYQLVGDDFLLSMARRELNCQFTKGHRIMQSGLCVSGQTIADAAHRIRSAEDISNFIVINVGSVDILHGHDLLDMKQDFDDLMNAVSERNISAMVTTLAPLANFFHRPNLKKTLERFNDFLRITYPVVDIWPIMVNSAGQTLYECYQSEARYVTGSNQPHVLWNKIGRQRILKCIKSHLQ